MADPCIRCGNCELVCPVDLHPQLLHAVINAQAWDQAEALHIDACLFCNACTAVCPSHINLKDQFYAADVIVNDLKIKQENRLQSKQRFEARESRLARKKQLQSIRIEADKKTAIQAALERAQWKYEDA